MISQYPLSMTHSTNIPYKHLVDLNSCFLVM
uniref:Uncharacterized protein n=1 Tax=Arundo donax TaxID=35708 RepID=A0A0A9BMS7_ARUDO